jgi:hypothetical protein
MISQIDALLTAAQSLFMLLPLSGLVAMSAGKPQLLQGPRAVIVVAATLAFALLVVMFHVSGSYLGVGLASGNLGLRIIEAVRVAQVHFRASTPAEQKKEQTERSRTENKRASWQEPIWTSTPAFSDNV